MNGFGVDMANFIYFYINLVYSKAGYNEPMQGWYPNIC